MTVLTNPALRLYTLLEQVTSWGSQNARRDWSWRQVWMYAMTIDPEKEGAEENFSDLMNETLILINSSEDLVKRTHTLNQGVHLRQFRRVKTALFGGGVQSWVEYRRIFNEDFMTSLQLVAENVSHHWYEEVIPADTLADIQAEVDDLVSRILGSGLPSELKRALVHGLEEVRRAIVNYRGGGADEFRKAVDSNIVAFGRNLEFFNALSDDEDKEVVSNYRNFISRVDGFTTAALKLKPLAGIIFDMLGIKGAE